MKDIKHVRQYFLFGRLGHARGVGLEVTVGGWGSIFWRNSTRFGV